VAPTGRVGASALERVRFGGGLLCLLVAVAVLLYQAPRTYRSFDANVAANSWRNRLDRLVAPGDITGLDKEFQLAALSLVPPNATYAVLAPPNPDVAEKAYGMNAITQAGLVPWLRYLLMPARMTDPEHARYVLCYGCDTDPWDPRTTWLWKNVHGEQVGKVRGR
jgi:hypothetical protein